MENEGKEPRPTELQQRYVRASRSAASRRLRVTLGAVLLALAVAVGLAAYALVARGQAISREKTARSLALAAASDDQPAGQIDASLLLSLEALRTRETAQARSSMISALEAARRSGAQTLLRTDQGRVNGVAFSPDGKTLASAGDDGTVVIRDMGTQERLGVLQGDSNIRSVAFSPDGRTLASGSAGGTVQLWDVARKPRLLGVLKGHGERYERCVQP